MTRYRATPQQPLRRLSTRQVPRGLLSTLWVQPRCSATGFLTDVRLSRTSAARAAYQIPQTLTLPGSERFS